MNLKSATPRLVATYIIYYVLNYNLNAINYNYFLNLGHVNATSLLTLTNHQRCISTALMYVTTNGGCLIFIMNLQLKINADVGIY